MQLLSKIIVSAILVAQTLPAFSQGVSQAFKDPRYPTRIKPQDLPSDMAAMTIIHGKPSGGGDFFSMMMSPMMMMMEAFGSSGEKSADPQQAAAANFFDRMGISWTNGSTVEMFEGEVFLVTYSVQVNLAEAMSGKNPPDLSKAELSLTYINTKMISSITPRPDMTKEEWLKPAPTPPPGSELEKEKEQTLSNLKQTGLAMLMYSADYDDMTPYAQSTDGARHVIMPYLRSPDVFKSLNPAGSDIRLNTSVAGVNLSDVTEPAETPLFFEATAWTDGVREVVFVDGSARFVSGAEWSAMTPKLSLKLPKVGKPLPASLGRSDPPPANLG